QSVFEAVLAALGLPRGWQKRLARAFGSADALEAALADLARPPQVGAPAGPAASLVAAGEAKPLADHIAALMQDAGISPAVGRTPDEIARRLLEKSDLSAVRLSDDAFAALRRFLAIRVPLSDAASALETFAASARLSLGAALVRF